MIDSGRTRRRRLVGLLAIGSLVAVGAAASHPLFTGSPPRARLGPMIPGHPASVDPRSQSRPPDPRGPLSAQVTVTGTAPSTPVPASFLGFSTEYWGLPADAGHLGLFRRLVSFVRVAGDPGFVLRIGGNSSDHSFWEPADRRRPRWMFPLTPRWLRDGATVVRTSHLRVILDLNLVTGTPQLASVWARKTLDGMPRGSVIGFEIGNEPDIYNRAFWLDHIGDAMAPLLPQAITASGYAGTYARYAASVARPAPRVPLLAPALAEPHRDRAWIAALLASAPARLGTVSVHQYPFNACSSPATASYPTVARLLSERATAGMAADVRPTVTLAATRGLPVRLTEFNSVTCGGVDEVSDSFATALWAPDALLSLAQAGVSAADLHVRAYSINSPFRFHRGRVSVRPLYYGLVMFTRLLGHDARLIRVHVVHPGHLRLAVWAVRSGARTLRVLLINKSGRSVRVGLRLPTRGAARVQRLLAPSPGSTVHVTLDGQRLNGQAHWIGRRTVQVIRKHRGRYATTVRRFSAALLSARLSARTSRRLRSARASVGERRSAASATAGAPGRRRSAARSRARRR